MNPAEAEQKAVIEALEEKDPATSVVVAALIANNVLQT